MKTLTYLSFVLILLNLPASAQQKDSTNTANENTLQRKFTIEPAIGVNPYPISDVLISNVAQWNISKRLSLASHTSYTFRNAFTRNFNHIETQYNYSISQKFGVGASVYGNHMSHTFSLLGGIKHDAFKETLNNPEFETVSASVKFNSPEFGLMYNLKLGTKKYFFSYRLYIPLYPYPVKTSDIYAISDNLANISMEFGFGIRLK